MATVFPMKLATRHRKRDNRGPPVTLQTCITGSTSRDHIQDCLEDRAWSSCDPPTRPHMPAFAYKQPEVCAPESAQHVNSPRFVVLMALAIVGRWRPSFRDHVAAEWSLTPWPSKIPEHVGLPLVN
ncbi:hypothetical protein BJX68DRAFT_130947 [Aspergillus pseudodeflectus]|uniref:Uncharacterized protein n=1 Tax=Aspergillus pseudodeflectus TaxID=176178 RepID=A0ABR4K0C4_9EURO